MHGRRGALDGLSIISRDARTYSTPGKAIPRILKNQYFGSEVTVYYPGLYAGSTDLVGIHNDKETIIDFKQANRPKREEWIGDYKLQAGAYAMAHDHVHGSNIEQCVIMVCTPDLYYQEFKIDGTELRKAKHDFLRRLDRYHELLREEEEKPTYGT